MKSKMLQLLLILTVKISQILTNDHFGKKVLSAVPLGKLQTGSFCDSSQSHGTSE